MLDIASRFSSVANSIVSRSASRSSIEWRDPGESNFGISWRDARSAWKFAMARWMSRKQDKYFCCGVLPRVSRAILQIYATSITDSRITSVQICTNHYSGRGRPLEEPHATLCRFFFSPFFCSFSFFPSSLFLFFLIPSRANYCKTVRLLRRGERDRHDGKGKRDKVRPLRFLKRST